MLNPPPSPDTAVGPTTPLGPTTAPSGGRPDTPDRWAAGAREPLLAAALLLLTGAVAAETTLRADATGLSWFTGLNDGGVGHGVARILVMGGQFWLAGTVLALLAAFRGWVQRSLRPLLVAGVAMAGLEAAVWALKALTGRTAPSSGLNAVSAGGTSYPSGHAAAATFAMLLGVALLGHSCSGRPRRRWPRMPRMPSVVGGTGAVTVGVCTLVLGYHWPSDAVGGWLIGALAAGVAARWLRPSVRHRPRPAEGHGAHRKA
ncbi:phosphatase PAP2 family protein [Knoellia koreensis]|uniref:Phosphatase PAP2 family protein n=1 Tax=Knoellia koreensis TaxID=2730921 RepID=A0A849HIR6_9MICO|nr:phosphatase PAP2 family protein [Knoellia sp. DB2414S]NNM47825.1 phosphatase PAP2 family protein [Knoellia sp. DB2414S]